MGSTSVPTASPQAGIFTCRTTTGLHRSIQAHITGDRAVLVAPVPGAELTASEAAALGQRLIVLAQELRLIESGGVTPIRRSKPGRAS
jgi:hypothetical protein